MSDKLTAAELAVLRGRYYTHVEGHIVAKMLRHIASLEAENKQLQAVEQVARSIANYGGGNGDDIELTISSRLLDALGDALHAYRRLR